jgi:hypothetical protein
VIGDIQGVREAPGAAGFFKGHNGKATGKNLPRQGGGRRRRGRRHRPAGPAWGKLPLYVVYYGAKNTFPTASLRAVCPYTISLTNLLYNLI